MFKYTLSQSFRTSLLIQMINLCMLVLSLRPFFSFCLLRSSPPLSLPLSLHFFCFLLPLLSFSFFLILFFLSLKLYSTCFDSRSFSVSDSPSTLSPPPFFRSLLLLPFSNSKHFLEARGHKSFQERFSGALLTRKKINCDRLDLTE